MALGGGNWTSDNKILPGTYVNFTNPSLATSALSTRGVVAVPLVLNWGAEGEMIELESQTIDGNSQKLLGYSYYDDEMLAVRELFKNATTVYAYRLGSEAVKATSIYGTAKYAGTRGNSLKILIKESIDREDYYSVKTYLDTSLVDSQEVTACSELEDNDYIVFVKTATIAETSGVLLSGGTDGEDITGTDYANFLTEAEKYSFDILCCPTDDSDTIEYFVAYTQRMNEETGANFQLVCYRPDESDDENVIALENKNLSDDLGVYGLVYWLSGAQAGCSVGQSLTGKEYDGELSVDVGYSQSELKDGLGLGEFLFHSVNGRTRVLRDINSFVSFDSTKSSDFSSNQTVRVCFSVANSIATLFNESYLGLVANDQSGRIALWNDICKLLEELQNSRAITDFSTQNVVISQGDEKTNVICTIKELVVAGTMEALYMNVVIM
ncbi:MAG: phage tail sheath family protein [Clostridia bacterium]